MTISPNLILARECPTLEDEENKEDKVGHVYAQAHQADLLQYKEQHIEQVDGDQARDGQE